MEAQKFNTRVLKKLKRSLEDHPSTDLSSVLPQSYSKRLKLLKEQGTNARGQRLLKLTGAVSCQGEINLAEEAEIKETIAIECDSIRLADSVRDVTIVHPLSCEVENLFDTKIDTDLSTQLRQIIANGEVLWRSSGCSGHAVVKCDSAVVVKIVPRLEDYTEYNTLEYLDKHASTIPVPKPLGLLASKDTGYIFISFIPGQTVRAILATLTVEQKSFIKNQLEEALAILRRIRRPADGLLGAIGGWGCKDTRRHVRVSEQPIHDAVEFRDFLFSNPHFGTSAYNSLLQNLLVESSEAIVFSHGDLRPENVLVQYNKGGNYVITGIIDWEKSGFYREYFESLKATSNISPSNADDWYLYLPSYAAPKTFALPWLVDRLWDSHVA